MRPRAVARFVRISPDKVRVVLDTIRGRDLNEAVAMLENTRKSGAEVALKVVNSAAANAEFQNKSRNDLYIAECFCDGGPVLKRIMPRAKGRAARILKRTSHITVVLDAKK
ncbi:MAG TPA: 50S ribosomal protein L22 [Eubacteriales bacterium]|nr:50S ribosomal protein L22 [Clostridia bacterium]HRR89362.1 50S ribosomal protein L22 [Eubacteriales bacterium]HRU83860.1 50S ribosomal protein L22 [Eubacteriales bacterium]